MYVYRDFGELYRVTGIDATANPNGIIKNVDIDNLNNCITVTVTTDSFDKAMEAFAPSFAVGTNYKWGYGWIDKSRYWASMFVCDANCPLDPDGSPGGDSEYRSYAVEFQRDSNELFTMSLEENDEVMDSSLHTNQSSSLTAGHTSF